jgi:hypothetical protein
MQVLCEAADFLTTPVPTPDLAYIHDLDLKKLVDVSVPVGKMVRKAFSKRPTMYNGQVVSVACVQGRRYYQWGPGVTATVAYHVEYEDGDGEDMTHAQVLEHHRAWLQWAQSAPSTACSGARSRAKATRFRLA